MKKKSFNKKLKLQKEIISNLTVNSLNSIKGGIVKPIDTNYTCQCPTVGCPPPEATRS